MQCKCENGCDECKAPGPTRFLSKVRVKFWGATGASIHYTPPYRSFSNGQPSIGNRPFFDVIAPNTLGDLGFVIACRTAILHGHSGASPKQRT